jgi:hypothetical protein
VIPNPNNVKHIKIKAKLHKSKHFQIQRKMLKITKFEKKRHKQKKDRKVQKNSGIVDPQPVLLGNVNLNKCTTNAWVPKLLKELEVQKVAFKTAEGLKKTQTKVLEHELSENSLCWGSMMKK